MKQKAFFMIFKGLSFKHKNKILERQESYFKVNFKALVELDE